MNIFQAFALTGYLQSMFGDSSKWTKTSDLSNVITSVKDKSDGTTDIVTTANSGIVFWTMPLKDYLGGPIDPANEVFSIDFLARFLSGSALDQIIIGTSDNADPLAGGALYECYGMRYQSGTTGDVQLSTDGGSTLGPTNTIDRVIADARYFAGRSQNTLEGAGHQGDVFVAQSVRVVSRPYVPTHLAIRYIRNTPAVHTANVALGHIVWPSIRNLAVTPRVA